MDVDNIMHGKLLTFNEDAGGYITYVFENLDPCDLLHKYLMCVRFPRWQCDNINIGDCGYIKYRQVEAGVDKWYDSNIDKYVPYKYTDIHFLDFILEKEKQDNIIL